jgi:hypothetical protein
VTSVKKQIVAGDPFIVHQVVARGTIADWNEVLF